LCIGCWNRRDILNHSHILPDLGAEFALSEDRFSADELQELTQLIELLLMKHPLLKK